MIQMADSLIIYTFKEEWKMSSIFTDSNVSTVANGVAAYSNMNNTGAANKSAKTSKNSSVNDSVSTTETGATVKKTKVSGKTIGTPELSEKAAKYYETLKKKYSNMDFILVSADMKEQAKSQAGSYANANKMVVLIDEEKIERMAEDEKFRKQYEGIIANAASGISQLGSKIASSGASVKGYGMQVNDNGTASYFAVLEKSSAAQKERIAKKSAENKAKKKEEQKKADKEAKQERLEKSRENNAAKKSSGTDSDDINVSEDSDTITITASSIDELLRKIDDYNQLYKSDNVRTDAEKKVGQRFDYSI